MAIGGGGGVGTVGFSTVMHPDSDNAAASRHKRVWRRIRFSLK